MTTDEGEALSLWAARQLCECILLWHQTRGVSFLKEQNSPDLDAYVAILRGLSASGLDTVEVMWRVANLQGSGKFEFAYIEQLPEIDEGLDMALRQLQVDVPTTLGSAARTIIDLLKENNEISNEGEQGYDLPSNWASEPCELRPGRVTLRIRGEDTVRTALQRHFRRLAQYEAQGLGGREVIVDMNEDAAAAEFLRQGDVVAYAPGSFGFSLATGSDTLPTLLVGGAVAVTVTLGERAEAEAHVWRPTDAAGSEGASE